MGDTQGESNKSLRFQICERSKRSSPKVDPDPMLLRNAMGKVVIVMRQPSNVLSCVCMYMQDAVESKWSLAENEAYWFSPPQFPEKKKTERRPVFF